MSRIRKNNNFSFWEHKGWLEGKRVVVVGAGFVGLSAAIECAKKYGGEQVLVLEAAPLNGGGSTKNAGFACFGSVSELLVDFDELGVEATVDLVRRRWQGLCDFRLDYGDEALGFEATGSHEMCVSMLSLLVESVDKVNSALREVFDGDDPFKVVESIPGVRHDGVSISSPFEGLIDTSKAYKAMLDRARNLGVEILNGLRVERVESGSVYMADGTAVKAGKILVCNNSLAKYLIQDLDVKPQANRVLVTEPISKLKFKGTLHFDRGYVYLRRIDSAEGPRMLVGGGRQWGDAESAEVEDKLLAFLRDHIEGCEEAKIDYNWVGYLGIGKDREPICEEVMPGVYAGVKMGGMGVALGGAHGKKLAELTMIEQPTTR